MWAGEDIGIVASSHRGGGVDARATRPPWQDAAATAERLPKVCTWQACREPPKGPQGRRWAYQRACSCSSNALLIEAGGQIEKGAPCLLWVQAILRLLQLTWIRGGGCCGG